MLLQALTYLLKLGIDSRVVPVPYGSGTAWTVRTASVIAILISVILLSRIGRRAYSRIRTQWCRLAARISLSLLIIISVLGSVIKEYLHWNTAVLFLTLFTISMRLMRRYENSFARSRMTDDWEQIKEHNEKKRSWKTSSSRNAAHST